MLCLLLTPLPCAPTNRVPGWSENGDGAIVKGFIPERKCANRSPSVRVIGLTPEHSIRKVTAGAAGAAERQVLFVAGQIVAQDPDIAERDGSFVAVQITGHADANGAIRKRASFVAYDGVAKTSTVPCPGIQDTFADARVHHNVYVTQILFQRFLFGIFGRSFPLM
jgi:hypothetical protein